MFEPFPGGGPAGVVEPSENGFDAGVVDPVELLKRLGAWLSELLLGVNKLLGTLEALWVSCWASCVCGLFAPNKVLCPKRFLDGPPPSDNAGVLLEF